MAMLDMLLPGGVSGAPDEPFYDPLSGMPIRGPSRRPGQIRQWPEPPPPPPSPPPDPNAWNPGATPVPYQGMLSNDVNAALPKPAPPLPPPTSVGPPPGMLSGSAIPPAAMPTSLPAPAAPSPAAAAAPLAAAASSSNVPETSILGRIGDALKAHSNTFLALGAGMAGAPSFGQGLSRGFAAAIPAGQADRINQSLPIIRDRLMKTQGLSADEANGMAMAAISNPAIMQQMVPGLFGAKQRQFTQIGEDMLGNKQFGFVDPVAGKVYDLGGKEIAGGGGAGAASDFLAKGVTDINHGLVGEDYLKQFSPEVQAAVTNYVRGESMPTGNPRKGFTQAVKMIAQKYGNDISVPADDNTYAGRHKAVTGLASTTPGSLGGQMTYARTSLNHLADVGEAAVDLDNSNGLGIAPLAHLINSARGLSTDQAAKVAALSDKAGHYGQEITKYYAGSPGGEGERTAFLDKLHGSKSNAELAAVLQSELELARGKISKTQSTIDESLGPNSKYQVMRPDEQRDAARVEAAIARLRGQVPAGGTAAPSSAPNGPVQVPDKQTYDRLPKGTAYLAPDGSLRTKQ